MLIGNYWVHLHPMKERVFSDPEIGQVRIVKSARSRRISIRVHPLRGVALSVPYFLKYDDGIRFFLQKKEWVKEALVRQRLRQDVAEKTGGAVGALRDGVTVRTLLSEIRFHRTSAGPGGSRSGIPPAVHGGAGRPVPDAVPERAITVTSALVEDVRQTGRLYLSPNLPLSRKDVDYPDSMPPENSAELSSVLNQVLVKILRDEARSLLPQKLAFFAGKYGFSYGKVVIKHNSTNWGSCSTRGNINLNLNLVRLPEPVCDYVLLHELSHLRHPDHGPEFHALLERLCSDNMKRSRPFRGQGIERIFPRPALCHAPQPCEIPCAPCPGAGSEEIPSYIGSRPGMSRRHWLPKREGARLREGSPEHARTGFYTALPFQRPLFRYTPHTTSIATA